MSIVLAILAFLGIFVLICFLMQWPVHCVSVVLATYVIVHTILAYNTVCNCP